MLDFKAEIYKIGINACVDVPKTITNDLTSARGQIKVRGTINGFTFKTTLMPVKRSFHRLYVNIPMLKGGQTAIGETAAFSIEQDYPAAEPEYPIPNDLRYQLEEKGLLHAFEALTKPRQKGILKYLTNLKTADILQKRIGKLIGLLENKEKNIRLP